MAFVSEKFIMPERKITEFLLKPGAKHSREFFDVGYTIRDGERLVREMEAQFDRGKAYGFRTKPDGTVFFTINMEFGVRKIRPYKTVWRIETPGGQPIFTSAYRRDLWNV